MSKIDVKTVMFLHSKAKVNLYTKYLSRYLNILARTPFINKIYLFDLMCGEGKYSDNSFGSPIEALKEIKEHYFSNNKTCPDIDIWFNDKGQSSIEPRKKKIDRVKEFASKIFIPKNVCIKYTSEDFSHIFPLALSIISNLKSNERALLFIDPYGYKEVTPEHIKLLLSNKNSELLVFQPISFMRRFAEKSTIDDSFVGGEPLKKFLNQLGFQEISIKSIQDFITQVTEAYKYYLREEGVFVDTFTLERDQQNMFCLFFFTHHIKGFEKMLETKWELDEQSGRGFKINTNLDFFSEVEATSFTNKLEEYILHGEKFNTEIKLFGLKYGFLPKHITLICKEWQKSNPYFKVRLLDGSLSRKGAFYLNEPEAKVAFRIENETNQN